MNKVGWVVIVLALSLLAAACGGVRAGVAGGRMPAGADSARQVLAQRLAVTVDEIRIVAAEAVEWPDACLGIPGPDVVCAAVVTPGHRVVLEAAGQRYTFHTDANGGKVELAAARDPATPRQLADIEWRFVGEKCQAASIRESGVTVGGCDGPTTTAAMSDETRAAQLAELLSVYAPFEAHTPAGVVTFTGRGTTTASPAEERMVAEWARLVAQEAEAGRSGASWGLAFAYHAEAGFLPQGSPLQCVDVSVYVDGRFTVVTCASDAQDGVAGRLDADRLEHVYRWVDELAPFERRTDDRAADGSAVTLVFTGAGGTQPDETRQQAVVALAQQLAEEAFGA